jgi:hypothetical protein
MLINEKEAARRLNSPDNLMNRLRSLSTTNRTASTTKAMGLFGIGNKEGLVPTSSILPQSNQSNQSDSEGPQQPVMSQSSSPSLDDLVKNADSKLKIELAHTAALDTLVSTVNRLKDTVPSLESPVKLSQIAMNMSRIMTSLTEKKEDKAEEDKQVHYHFYMPEQNKMDDYKVIDVN